MGKPGTAMKALLAISIAEFADIKRKSWVCFSS
jgi:hypothetical protein